MKPVNYIIDIIIAILVLILFPIIYLGQKQDALTQTIVSSDTKEFVDEVRRTGYITKEMYEEYLDELSKTRLFYDVTMEQRQILYEPEYRFRTPEEVIEEQDAAYTGSNVYTYHPITTDVPTVADPINTGSLNTETNASVLASAICTPASASHIHTEDCYKGHRHDSSCTPVGDMSKKVIVYYSRSYDSSDGKNYFHFTVTCATCGKWLLYSYYGYNMAGFSSAEGNAHIQTYPYNSSGSVVTNVLSYTGYWQDGSTANWHNHAIFDVCNSLLAYCRTLPLAIYNYNNNNGNYSGTSIPVTWEYGSIPYFLREDNVIHYTPWTGCTYCGVYGQNYSCGQVQAATPDCNKIVTSITPTHPLQTVAIGDPLITTMTAQLLDGSSHVVVGTTTFSTENIVQDQTATLTYTYIIEGITYTKTCTIVVSVIPRSNTCVNGHTYNLNNDGSDPGCPYCRAWLKSLSVVIPATYSITIYKGTTLSENGVTLLATYIDGRTEYLDTGYVDNLDKQYVGTQNVTISYKGKYAYITVISKRNLTRCSVCGRYYELYPDGSDPGCPYCRSLTPIFTGNIMEYHDKKFTEEILKELYEGDGTYIFSCKDYFVISVTNRSKSFGESILSAIYKNEFENSIMNIYGGYIREDAQ